MEREKVFASFEEYPTYEGQDLGLTKSGSSWTLKVWAPTADLVLVNFYEDGIRGDMIGSENMTLRNNVWELVIDNPPAPFYAIQTVIDGIPMEEVVDPYVKMVGVNGRRGYFGLPSDASPEGWEGDVGPVVAGPNDMVIYELHVRDLSMHESSGIEHKGKFLGFTEKETSTPSGIKTGLAHLKELGITHVHILPSFDYRSIDETQLDENVFNWGYDPQNYNVPEGSYATDPYEPESRVTEMKAFVKALHDEGIGVILDVVYNHTGFTEESLFNQLVPKYYYRLRDDGSFSDASACGNETASERFMMRKFMQESMRYWMEEYHIDGFRVDLMGIHDIETMNLISRSLKEINPSVFIYGEGWTASSSPLPDSLRALKAHTLQLDDIAAFSDELRDGIKGHWSNKNDRGFVSGKEGTKESLKFGIVGAIDHPQVRYGEVNYTNMPWAREPSQTMSYVSCHDDMTLWDKLQVSTPHAGERELIKMHKLANTIVMTSQGVPFLHGGVDFLRSKMGVHNSFESSDTINSINWNRKEKYLSVFQYYQGLISLRQSHPAFRMGSAEMVRNNLRFLDGPDELVIGFQLADNANGDDWANVLVFFNGNGSSRQVTLPDGQWTAVLAQGEIDLDGLGRFSGQASLPGRSALILHD